MDNFLSGAMLDRSGLLRRDKEWLRIAFQDPAAKVLCYCEGDPLIRGGIENPEPVLLGMERNARSFEEADAVFLGIEEGAPVFAMDVGNAQAVDPPASAGTGVRTDFREVAALLSRPAGALLAYGRALLLWHARHPFCSLCGSRSLPSSGGHLRICSDPSCGAEHYPRTDPAVIMLVTRGDQCLLGRQASWPENLYSTLAGFVEGGESLEEAVRREVYEEAGIEVGEVTYHSSQPWPFPSSLMIGFTANARSSEIRLHDSELADARWFSREEIDARLAARALRLSRPVSIARRLIEDWRAAKS